jgi:intracellular sulfur oxidation DsrE/DsrF family protein
MSRYLRAKELQIDPETVTPLYMQSSIVLVRPDNPKEIKDFPDLLRPNVNVMVVTGTGLKDLWADMAGRLADIRTLRTLRKKVAVIAETGVEAMRFWKERPEIDAWVTWNLWFVPFRNEAKLVPVSRDYGIHRRCSVALTNRGKSNSAAVEFVKFLASPEGFKVFESWGWVQGDRSPLAVNTDICAVCRINEDKWAEGVGADLLELRRLVQEYEELGIPTSEVHISAVFDGDAAYWLSSDQAYRNVKRGEKLNPNKALIEELTRLGVSLEISEQAMRDYGWQKSDVLSEVKIVPSAQIRLIDLQEQGYAHILLGGPRSGHLHYPGGKGP